jgi:hypothetical protein
MGNAPHWRREEQAAIAQQLAIDRRLDECPRPKPYSAGVCVLVSYEALSQLDPTNVRDLHGALENFDRFRSQVEAAASRKFDSHGFDAEKYEGMPAIRLTADDMM